MSQNLLSGKTGGVLVNGTAWSMGKWSAPLKCNIVKVNNWVSSPYQAVVAGLLSSAITISGPYDLGNMPATAGNSYIFTLQWTASVSLVITALIESIEPDNDVDGSPGIKITAQSNGVFAASIT